MTAPTRPGRAPASAAAGLRKADRERAQRLLVALGRLGAVISAELRGRVGEQLTSNVEVTVLSSLDLLGPQRPSDVIELTGMTSGGVTKVLDRLETQGLIRREHGRVEGDRRAILLSLTPSGEKAAAAIAAGLAAQMDVVREVLDEVRSELAD